MIQGMRDDERKVQRQRDGGRKGQQQDEAFALKAKGPTEKDA